MEMPSPFNRTKAKARSEDTEGEQFRGFERILRDDMSAGKWNKSAETLVQKASVAVGTAKH
jgi:hypothetical protein